MSAITGIFQKIIAFFVGIFTAIGSLFGLGGEVKQNVDAEYYLKSTPAAVIEQTYTALGKYDVSYIEYTAGNDTVGKFEIWYPTAIGQGSETYPLVVMANGTGIKASTYKAIFKHLASWGFIVIGNEDENSWSGATSAESLDYMLALNNNADSIFYKKIDTDNIGIAGHSQGGVGVINAVTNQTNGKYYAAMYSASATHLALAESLSWPYDVSKISIPYFMTAGTGVFDSGLGTEENPGIASLSSLQENYSAIPDGVTKILARRSQTDHGDMLVNADGYMTAWFMWQLKNDTYAAGAFVGNNAEILSNSNWQDVTKNF